MLIIERWDICAVVKENRGYDLMLLQFIRLYYQILPFRFHMLCNDFGNSEGMRHG